MPDPAPGFARHPDHRVRIEPCNERLSVRFNNVLIADSCRALVVRESGYAPVAYFPPGDVRRDLLAHSHHSTYCPFKGEASYWSVAVGERRAEDAVWSYLSPYDECLALRGYFAFYPERLDAVDQPA